MNTQGNNQDWSLFEEIHQEGRARQGARNWTNSDPITPEKAEEVQTPLVTPLQDQRILALRDEANGILARFKANSIRREAAIDGLRKVVAGQLEVLQHYVETAVLIKKSRIDVDAQAFLAQLDSENLRILGQFKVHNIDQRARTLFSLNDRYVALISEAQQKQWPPSLIRETMKNLSDLYTRVSMEINEDFPSRHQRRP